MSELTQTLNPGPKASSVSQVTVFFVIFLCVEVSLKFFAVSIAYLGDVPPQLRWEWVGHHNLLIATLSVIMSWYFFRLLAFKGPQRGEGPFRRDLTAFFKRPFPTPPAHEHKTLSRTLAYFFRSVLRTSFFLSSAVAGMVFIGLLSFERPLFGTSTVLGALPMALLQSLLWFAWLLVLEAQRPLLDQLLFQGKRDHRFSPLVLWLLFETHLFFEVLCPWGPVLDRAYMAIASLALAALFIFSYATSFERNWRRSVDRIVVPFTFFLGLIQIYGLRWGELWFLSLMRSSPGPLSKSLELPPIWFQSFFVLVFLLGANTLLQLRLGRYWRRRRLTIKI